MMISKDVYSDLQDNSNAAPSNNRMLQFETHQIIFHVQTVGKTTFTKLLTGELQPNKGEVEIGETVVLGVYDQLGLKFDEIAEKQTILEYVVDQIQSNGSKSMGETPSEARALLRQFEFPRSRWQERISVLSGGERRRLQILSVLSVVSIQQFNAVIK